MLLLGTQATGAMSVQFFQDGIDPVLDEIKRRFHAGLRIDFRCAGRFARGDWTNFPPPGGLLFAPDPLPALAFTDHGIESIRHRPHVQIPGECAPEVSQ